MKFWQVVSLAFIFCINTVNSKSLYDGEKYWAIDSSELNGPVYDFEDISQTGNLIAMQDDSTYLVAIGFDFPFYDQVYSTVRISSNGYISFDSTSNGCCSGQSIPGSVHLKAGIAAWWEDLDPGNGVGSVSYQSFGVAPNRHIIIQFTDIPSYPNNGRSTFQYKLYELNQTIEVHYKELYGDSGKHVVGIQKQDASVGIQYYSGSGHGQNASIPFELPFAISYNPKLEIAYVLSSETGGVDIPINGLASFEITLINQMKEDVEFYFDYLNSEVTHTGLSRVTVEASPSGKSIYSFDINVKSDGELYGVHDFPIKITTDLVDSDQFLIDIELHFSDLIQLSSSSDWGSKGVSVSEDGSSSVFISREDLANTGKLNSIYDVFYINTHTNNIKQITNNGIGKDCSEAKISADGQWVIALCNSSLDSDNPNTSGVAVLYLYDVMANSIAKVTAISRELPIDQDTIDLNSDGSKVIFLSEFDAIDGSETYESIDVYSYTTRSHRIEKLSDFNYGNNTTSLSLDYSGFQFVVSSAGDPLLKNGDHSYEVFLGDLDRGIFDQLTKSDYDSGQSTVSGNSEWVSFSSGRKINEIDGSSVVSPSQVYKINVLTKKIDAITQSNNYNSSSSSINFDGSKIVFVSHASLSGSHENNSADNGEVFLRDYNQNTLLQLTEINSSYDAKRPMISEDGAVIVFDGQGDWNIGNNPSNQSQVFALNGLESRPVYLTSVPEEKQIVFGVDSSNKLQSNSKDGTGGLDLFLLIGLLPFIRLQRVKRFS